jgi:hypothetical protein
MTGLMEQYSCKEWVVRQLSNNAPVSIGRYDLTRQILLECMINRHDTGSHCEVMIAFGPILSLRVPSASRNLVGASHLPIPRRHASWTDLRASRGEVSLSTCMKEGLGALETLGASCCCVPV